MSSPLNFSIRQTPHVNGRRSALGRLFGWILAVAGVALLLLGADETRRAGRALTWPSVTGRVDSAWISADIVATRPTWEGEIEIRLMYEENDPL